MPLHFNPFNSKPIELLEETDLNLLIQNNVSEGWFVEYKAQIPDNSKIAKSIASFANSEGGWLVIGIIDDTDNAAKEIVGFNISKLKQPKEHVKNIVSTHITPVPFFESKLITLANGNGLLVIKIDKSEESPHILSDGKIYRRIGEGSEPIAETNRYAVDELYKRNKNTKDYFERFSKNTYVMSKRQKNQEMAFIEIYFFCMPVDSKYFPDFYTSEFAEKIRKNFLTPVNFIKGLSMTSNIDVSFFQASSGSYILRPNQAQINPQLVSIVIEIFENRSCKILIPIEEITTAPVCENEHLDKILKEMDLNSIRIIDGYNFTIRFLTIVEQYLSLLDQDNGQFRLGTRMKLTGLWNKALYIDDERYLAYVKKFGLPLSLKDEIEIPEFNGTRRLEYEIKPPAFALLRYVYEALGVPPQEIPDFFNNFGNFINSLQNQKKSE